ncbi:MAG: hypothetical protein QM597_01535 [Aeromicrobium sp.]|uniref:hypothetical protein n=1 Tax=Aeromicrobium sp. TaxID=1871063 RepID=UPI0039E39658
MDRADEPFEHWCEVCGREERLTSQAAYEAGWDFPPRMGAWEVVSPRTCGQCGMGQTVWWAITMEGVTAEGLTEHQRDVVARITAERSGVVGRSSLELTDGGSWVISTASGARYAMHLDGEQRTIQRLQADTDAAATLRRDGETLPLLGLIEPPIQVGRSAYLVVGDLSGDEGYVSTTRVTSPVVEIRRLD